MTAEKRKNTQKTIPVNFVNMPAKAKKAYNSIDWFIALLSFAGIIILIYLAKLHYSSSGTAFCDISEGISCSVVNQSIYADIFGIPVSLLGIVYFSSVIVLLFSKKIKKRFFYILLFSVFSLLFSIYLSAVEYIILQSVCIFCELSKLLMVAIIVMVFVRNKAKKQVFDRKAIILSAVVGLVFSGIVFYAQSSNLTAADYSETAICLTEKQVVMYGTYWCPNCAKQRRAFGDSFQYINEVECDPRGENPQTERCIERQISKTPTWILEPAGEEQSRLVGARSVKELADFFECPITN